MPSRLGHRGTDVAPLPDDVAAAYRRNVLALLKLRVTSANGGDTPHQLLHLSPDARDSMRRFDAWLEPQLSEFGDLGNIADWAGKLSGAVGRIAGLLHMADLAGTATPWEVPVPQETVDRAIRVGKYLIPHARVAFAEMGADREVEQAKRVLRWIEHRNLFEFTKREVHQGLKATFKRGDELDRPLSLLNSHGFIRKRPELVHPGPGRPRSPVFEVNPIWASQNAQNPQKVNTVTSFEDFEDSEEPRRSYSESGGPDVWEGLA